MWKALLSRLGSCLFLATSVATADAQLTSLTEGFDNPAPSTLPSVLQSNGWVITNNSSPVGNHDWNQGLPGNQTDGLGVNAQSDPPSAADSFIQTDFNAGQPG